MDQVKFSDVFRRYRQATPYCNELNIPYDDEQLFKIKYPLNIGCTSC